MYLDERLSLFTGLCVVANSSLMGLSKAQCISRIEGFIGSVSLMYYERDYGGLFLLFA